MATYSNLGITLITTGDESGTWGTTTNGNFNNILDEAIAGAVTYNISSDADFTLTVVDATSSDARHAVIKFTSTTLSATRTCTFAPNDLQKTWVVINATTGGQSLTFKQGSAGATVTVPNGESAIIYSDGAGASAGAITRVLDSFTNTKITTGTLNATTLDLTNLEVTNIKAKDGTAALTIADSTGKVTVSSELAVDNLNLSGNAITSTDGNGNIDLTPNGTGEVNITKVDIDSGAIDGTTIGANSAAAATFTTATATTGNITTVNATTVDATNVEVTNVKAKDGTAAIVISDTSGNVGLSANLTFSSTGQRITGDMSTATFSNRLAFQTSTTNSATSVSSLPNGTGTASNINCYNNSDPTNSSLLLAGTNATEALIQSAIRGTGTYLPMTFYTGGSERLRLDTSGNLGIGTASPGYKLQVNGFVGVTDGTSTIRLANSGGVGLVSTITNHPLAFQTNDVERVRIDSSGNVGIGGTADAYAKVQVRGTLPTSSNISLGFSSVGTIPSGSTGGAYLFHTNANTATASFTCPDLYHYFTYQNAFGAGSVVTRQYGFYADAALTGATNNYGFYSSIASGSNRWNFYAAGTAKNYFAGQVGINKDPSAQLNVSADTGTIAYFQNSSGTGIYINAGDNTWTSASDERLKTDLAPIENAIEKLSFVRAITGRYKNDNESVSRPFLIAQDVQKVFPQAVSDSNPNELGLRYSEMIPLLVAAIKELSAKVAALEAK